MNFKQAKIWRITESWRYGRCSNPSADLNYPSFMVLYRRNQKSIVGNFRRIVTNVGLDVVTYKARVVAPNGSQITVSPTILRFGKKNEKQSYTLIVKYEMSIEIEVSSGELVWLEEGGNHTVRSPIVISLDNRERSFGLC